MINVVDRVPTYPNRVKITKSDGSSELVTWERADAPTVEGTPINKALFDSIVADIGATKNMTLYVSTAGSDVLGDGTSANPYATIQRAIGAVPRNLNGYTATINIAAGAYAENVGISTIHGGIVILSGEPEAAVEINSLQVVHGVDVQVTNISLTVSGMIGNNAIVVTNARLMCFSPVATTGSAQNGVYANQNAYAQFTEFAASNVSFAAINSVNASRVVVVNVVANNNVVRGLHALFGGIIAYNTESIVANVKFSTLHGGRIYSGAQINSPQY